MPKQFSKTHSWVFMKNKGDNKSGYRSIQQHRIAIHHFALPLICSKISTFHSMFKRSKRVLQSMLKIKHACAPRGKISCQIVGRSLHLSIQNGSSMRSNSMGQENDCQRSLSQKTTPFRVMAVFKFREKLVRPPVFDFVGMFFG